MRSRDSKRHKRYQKKASVRFWWQSRLDACKIFFIEDVREAGKDYIGELPWPERVMIDAVYNDYVLWAIGQDLDEVITSKKSFIMHLRNFMGLPVGEIKTQKLILQDGRKLYNYHRMMYDIGHLNPRRHQDAV